MSMRETFSLLVLGISILSNPGRAEMPTSWKQKEFFITFWSPPPADDNILANVAAEHYNLTWTPVEGLDVAAKHRMRWQA
jgi:hypothetical protein